MLTGGKGIHVIVPLRPEQPWATVTDFAHRFALAFATAEPDRFVATMSKAKRKGRIFIDWLRNQRGSTAIVPYSVRARSGAPVAVPINWTELDDFQAPTKFTISAGTELRERATGRALAGWCISDQVLPRI